MRRDLRRSARVLVSAMEEDEDELVVVIQERLLYSSLIYAAGLGEGAWSEVVEMIFWVSWTEGSGKGQSSSSVPAV